MAERLIGLEAGIFVNVSETETPDWELAGGQTDATLTVEPDDIDVSSKDGEGWKNNRNGLLGWSIEMPGTYISGKESLAKLEAALIDEENVLVKFELVSGDKRQGLAKVKSLVKQAPQSGGLTYSIRLAGDGKLESMTGSVDKTTVTTPADEAEEVALTETLATAAFATSDGDDVHSATQWQITEEGDATFATPVFDCISMTQKTALTLGGDELEASTAYLIRARHKGRTLGWGEWSDTNAFETAAGA